MPEDVDENKKEALEGKGAAAEEYGKDGKNGE